MEKLSGEAWVSVDMSFGEVSEPDAVKMFDMLTQRHRRSHYRLIEPNETDPGNARVLAATCPAAFELPIVKIST